MMMMIRTYSCVGEWGETAKELIKIKYNIVPADARVFVETDIYFGHQVQKMYQELVDSRTRIRYPVTVIRISDNRLWTSSYIRRAPARDCIPNYFP
jgi:hypothetical protein